MAFSGLSAVLFVCRVPETPQGRPSVAARLPWTMTSVGRDDSARRLKGRNPSVDRKNSEKRREGQAPPLRDGEETFPGGKSAGGHIGPPLQHLRQKTAKPEDGRIS